MRKAWLASACLALIACAPNTSAEDGTELIALYKHLHANPELSNMETETAARMADELRAAGFEVTEGVGGTGVVAVLENGAGETVMLRADMDGLPVVEETGFEFASTRRVKSQDGEDQPAMHACGHDIHMTSVLGAARELVDKRDVWAGTLVVIMQPAEETVQGAPAMLEDGLFTRFPRPDYNLALHVNSAMPTGTIGYTPGYALANVDTVDIVVKGIGGHGAYPNTTKDPIVVASALVMSLQTIVSRETQPGEAAVVTVGSIHGGEKHNIISNEVKLQLTVRSYTDEVRESTLASIRRMSENVAKTYGLPDDLLPEVTVLDQSTPATFNNPELTGHVAAHLTDVFSSEAIIEIPPVMGGEDFAHYGRAEPKIPSLIYWLGAASPEAYTESQRTGDPLPSLHSPIFAPDYEEAIPMGVQSLSEAALHLFQN
jgi:hippurate hydrolase